MLPKKGEGKKGRRKKKKSGVEKERESEGEREERNHDVMKKFWLAAMVWGGRTETDMLIVIKGIELGRK